MRLLFRFGLVLLVGLFFYLFTGGGVEAWLLMVVLAYFEWRFMVYGGVGDDW